MRFVRLACVCLLAYLLLAAPAAPAPVAHKASVDKMVAKLNAVRARHGLGPLRASPSLTSSAGHFARWMVAHDYFGHRGGVSANHGRFSRLGEAIAMHSGRKLGVGLTVRSWLRSPTHRAVVLTRSMRWVGVGVARGRVGSRRAVIWVLQTGGR